MSPLATLGIGFVGGVASWFVTSFVGEPIQHFRMLRRSSAAKLSEFGNVGPPSAGYSPEQRREAWDEVQHARAKIRRCAVDISALAATQPLLTAILKRLGYDVGAASKSLMGVSNTLHEFSTSRHENRKAFNKAMKLPGY